jgi:O-antigen/teichoic acid export membrane protein
MSKTDEHFSTMIHETAKGSAILIIGQMASTAIGALGAILVARLLGSTSYGLIAIASIPVNIALMAINNGIRPAIINHIVENRVKRNDEKIKSTVLAGFTVNLSIGLVATIAIYVLSGYISNQVFSNSELEPIIKILSLTIFAYAINSTATGVLVGLERMVQRSLVTIVYSLFKTILGPVLIFLGYGLIGASFGYTIPYLLSGLFAVILVYVNLRKNAKTVLPTMDEFRSLTSYASPLFVSNLLTGSIYQVLNFILPFYVTATLIGNLGAAISFTVLISFFLTPITTATFPLLSKLNPEDTVFEHVYQSIIKYETLIAYPVAAAVLALSGRMVEILYGGDFLFTSYYVQVLMLGYFFIGFGDTVNTTLLNSQKQTKVTLRRTLIYIAFGIPLGIFLIPRYGILGFQVTTIIAQRLGSLYTIWWVRKNMNIQLDIGNTFKILASTVLGYAACQLMLMIVDLNPWFEIILGGTTLAITYIIAVILTGALSAKNLKDIKNITDRVESTRKITDPMFKYLLRLAKNNTRAYKTGK